MIHVAIMASGERRRNWLERRLGSEPSVKITGAVSTFALVRSLLNESEVDAVLIDWAIAAESEIARDWLGELLDMVPVVILTASPDPWAFNQLIRTQRGAILNNDASVEQIFHALRAVSAGLLVFDSSVIPRPDSVDELASDLTPREIQVLRLLAEGLGNRDIAERLGISEHTIKFHIGSILGKLQATSRTEAVTRGLRSGLIEL